MPPSYVPYKGTYVWYDGTFGTPDQGQIFFSEEAMCEGSSGNGLLYAAKGVP